MNRTKNHTVSFHSQIYLIGYRASGKTSVGIALAKNLNLKFMDTDAEIVKQNGEIADIVKNYGWDVFRKKEKEIIQSINPTDNLVIALGGGAIIEPDNIKTVKNNGTVIFLKASPDVIKKRLLNDDNTKINRPSLSTAGTFEEVDKILAIREPVYKEASDFIIDTDNKTIPQICRNITECLYLPQKKS